MRLTSQKKVIVPGITLLLNISVLPLALVLVLIRVLFHVKIVRVRSNRIGPMAGTDLFLRRIALGKINADGLHLLGIANRNAANNHFLKMLQREIKIVQIPQPKFLRIAMQILASQSVLSTWGLFQNLGFLGNEYSDLNESTTSLHFTAEEEKQGKQLLKDLNVKSWFVCFHARDSAYLDQLLQKRDYRHDFRNGEIENYLPAAEYITQQNGWALRLGAVVNKPILTTNTQIIDYATQFRSDFGDIYLPAHCKFYLGNTAGLCSIPYVFGIPVANANVIPLTRGPPPGKRDLFIPKKIWVAREQRFFTFKEMIYSPILERWQEQEFREADGLIPLENTAREILDLAVEMNERLDGTWKTTDEDEELQQRFKALFSPQTHCYGFPSRLGAKFLRENKVLLEG